MIKDYYSLNEIEKKYGIMQEDAFWMVEQQKIRLFLFCKLEKILVGFRDEQGFHAVGYASYRGIILAPQYLEQKLADDGTVEVGSGRVAKPLSALDINMAYPYETEPPNKLIASWGAKNQDKTNSKFPEFIFLPIETNSIAGLVLPILDTQNNSGIESPLSELSNVLKDQPMKSFANKKRKFSLEDVRISYQSLQLLKQQSATDNPIRNSEPLHKQLIRRAIIKHPTYSSGKLLDLLAQDLELDSPVLDTENILLEVSKTEIAWQARDGSENTLTYASFKNLVSKIKKEK